MAFFEWEAEGNFASRVFATGKYSILWPVTIYTNIHIYIYIHPSFIYIYIAHIYLFIYLYIYVYIYIYIFISFHVYSCLYILSFIFI